MARTAPVCWTGTGAAGSSGVTDPSCCHGNESYSRPPWVGHVSLGSVWGPRRQSARERTVARRAELGSSILSTRQCDRSADQPDRFVVVVNNCRFRGVVVLSRRRCATLRSRSPRRVRDHLVTKLLRVPTVIFPRGASRLLSACSKSTHGAVTANRGRLCLFLLFMLFFTSYFRKKKVTSKIMRTRAEKPLNT